VSTRAFFKKKVRAEPEQEQGSEFNEESLDPILRSCLMDTNMTREKAIQIPAVTGVIDEIAKTVANIPIKLYKKENGKIIELEGDRRVFLLNEETGDTLDAVQMKQAIVRDYYLSHGGFIYVDWNGLEVESLRYVESKEISIAQNSDVIFKDYVILVQGKSYFPSQFVRVLRNTTDGMRGNSIVKENDKLLSVLYNSLIFEEVLVKTGGNKKGFVKSTKKLTQEAINRLKQAWRKLYQNNTENVVILNDGLDFQEASNTSVEMQLNENKKTNTQEVKHLLGVPDDLATEQGDKTYIKYSINTFMGEFMTALNRALLLESEKNECFFAPDMYELTKGDEDKRYAAYKTAAETGWLQIDEIRAKENMEPLGIDMVKLGLQDVLYDPKTKRVYIPNMNQQFELGKGQTEGQE
jgi:HK97 family phage portal protein